MPPPGGKDKKAEQNFANFMTSTAGGTQGSSSYGVNTPSAGTDTSAPNYPGGSVVDQAIQNFQNQQQIQEEFEQKQQQNEDKGVVTEADKELERRKEKKKLERNEAIKSFVQKYMQMGGITGAFGQAAMLPFRMIAEPTVETFQNPQSLAVLKLLFDEKGKEFKDQYLADHGDILNDAFKDERELLKESGQGITTLDFFNKELDEAARMSEEGVLGAGSQQLNFPSEFYTGEKGLNPYGAGGMPQTSGDLVNLASLAVTPEMQGANPELANMIFAARAELDRMGKNPFTGNPQGGGQGGGAGIPSVTPPVTPPPSGPTPTPQQPTLPPGITPPLNPSTRFPDSVIRDYTQLGLPQIYGNQQMPNYANFYQGQGGQPVGLQNYLDNLRRRFGIG
jgi:hypothetical protein